jgi:hypothetical protein
MDELTVMQQVYDTVSRVGRALKSDFSEIAAHEMGDRLLAEAERLRKIIEPRLRDR